MPDLFSGTTRDSRLTNLMSEEMRETPFLETTSSHWGITNSSFPPPPLGKFHWCWLIEDLFSGFVSCISGVVLPSKILCFKGIKVS